MRSVRFIKDFATKKSGERYSCDSMLASHLVNIDKVAVYIQEPEIKSVEKPKIEPKKPRKKTK